MFVLFVCVNVCVQAPMGRPEDNVSHLPGTYQLCQAGQSVSPRDLPASLFPVQRIT